MYTNKDMDSWSWLSHISNCWTIDNHYIWNLRGGNITSSTSSIHHVHRVYCIHVWRLQWVTSAWNAWSTLMTSRRRGGEIWCEMRVICGSVREEGRKPDRLLAYKFRIPSIFRSLSVNLAKGSSCCGLFAKNLGKSLCWTWCFIYWGLFLHDAQGGVPLRVRMGFSP